MAPAGVTSDGPKQRHWLVTAAWSVSPRRRVMGCVECPVIGIFVACPGSFRQPLPRHLAQYVRVQDETSTTP
jgi:hypothetical protein